MLLGTTIPLAKQALIDLIDSRVGDSANVQYARPTDTADLRAGNGAAAVIYLDTQIDCSYDIPFVTAGTMRIDETYTVPVVIQYMALENETQQDCDTAAAELAHGVLGALAQNPNLNITSTTELQTFVAKPTGGTYMAEAAGDSPAFYVTRHVINVEVYARLILS